MALEALAIWLYDRQIAIVEKQRNARLRLFYTEQNRTPPHAPPRKASPAHQQPLAEQSLL